MKCNQNLMHIKNYYILGVFFFYVSKSVLGEQWEIGTWEPDTGSNPPSVSPSTIPTALVRESSGDSMSPTLEETMTIQSMEPSDRPSIRPSHSPTSSTAPSISNVSFSVTIKPSSSPSLFPSMMPTPKCHDLSSYRSPLNSLNCTQHSGTDCFEWKHLGLTDLEVEQLIVSCPIACGIECDSLIVFETNLTYWLLFVDNFLAPESTSLFEDASADYIAKYIRSKDEKNKFSMNRVLLLSQRMREKVGPTRRLIRTLQTSEGHHVDLEINVAFRGFVLDVDVQALEMLIIEGIQTFGYMRALRFTNDPALQEVEVVVNVGSNGTAPTPAIPVATTESSNSSPWIITVAVLSFIVVAVFGMLYLRVQRSASPAQSEKDFDSPVISPAASARSSIVPTFSYESIARFTPIILGQRSGTSIVDSTGDDSSLKSSPNASMLSTAESVEEEHPLTGIVPSMIVYDCIDGSEELIQTMSPVNPKDKLKNVVPTRHLAATVSFRKALQENSLEVLDKSMFVGIPDSFTGSPSAIGEVSIRLDTKKVRDKIAMPKQLPEGEATSSSDALTVRAGVGELLHSREGGSNNAGPSTMAEVNSENPSSMFRQHQRYQMQLDTEGSWITINAPRAGKLGLVIQSSERYGHVVIQVKTYSPMKRDIVVGDRIICIDGQDATGMSLTKVTKLISGTIDEFCGPGGSLEILVWRPNAENVKTGVEIPYLPIPKASGYQRSVSGSSTRSALSAPPLGSYRSHKDYDRQVVTAHRTRKTASMAARSRHKQYYASSHTSTRSTSSTPNAFHHARSTRERKMSPEFHHQSFSSRNIDPFMETRRRMILPITVPTPRSNPNTQTTRDSNEC